MHEKSVVQNGAVSGRIRPLKSLLQDQFHTILDHLHGHGVRFTIYSGTKFHRQLGVDVKRLFQVLGSFLEEKLVKILPTDRK